MALPSKSPAAAGLQAALLSAAILVWGGAAAAQQRPDPPPDRAPPPAGTDRPLYDPLQLPAYHGRVQQFTLTPRGDIDGLILSDGSEVKTPPHLSTQIAYSIRPGDSVTIHGMRAAALPLIQAVSITDERDNRTIVDSGPPGPGPRPRPRPAPLEPAEASSVPPAGLDTVQGRIRMLLHGPRGDVNGALLDDGTILRLPPPEAARFADLLQPGYQLVATGSAQRNPLGTVLDVRQLGASQDRLTPVAPDGPPGPPPRR